VDFHPCSAKGKVHLIDSDLIDRPSPRVVDGLESWQSSFTRKCLSDGARRTVRGKTFLMVK